MATIILGLDGMNFPFFEYVKSEMPNLSKLLGKGAYGTFKSAYPPLSAPSWLNIFTGKDIGSHGFLYYFYYDSEMNIKLINSEEIKEEHFYETIFKSGGRVFLMDVPFSSPRNIPGDFLDYCFSTRSEEEMIKPKNLVQKFPNIKNFINYKKKLEDYDEIITSNGNIIKDVITAKEHDLIFFQLGILDWIQHRELMNFKLQKKTKKTKVAREMIKKLDDLIGWITNNIGSEDNFLIISDHGLGEYKKTLFLNTWLKQEGYIKLKNKDSQIKKESFKDSLIRKLTYIAKSNQHLLNVAKLVHSRFRKTLGKDVGPHESIDYIESSAACLIKNVPIIKILETDIQKKEIIKEELIKKLNEKLGFTAKDVLSFYNCKNKTSKEKLLSLGDIILDIKDYRWDISFGSKVILEGSNIFHDKNAIFIMYGKGIKNREIKGSLVDIAPTILYSFGLNSGNMDGKVLDIFEKPISHINKKDSTINRSTISNTENIESSNIVDNLNI